MRGGKQCLILWLAMTGVAGGDWPTYRGDDQRSGVADEELKLPLVQVWSHQAAHAPSPAWPEPARQDVFRRVSPLGPTTTYDRAFHMVTCGNHVYYASSADDTVYCLSAADGHVEWSFTTDGPIRLAPTVLPIPCLCVGSDDGCVYILDVDDGHLRWKYRAGPADRRLPGNGRMISLWPVRCMGADVPDSILYVCAGLFPEQGVYLCAIGPCEKLEHWKQKIDVASQGYMAASSEHLYVPTGRTSPRVFERLTGKALGPLPGGGANSLAGGCFTVVVDDAAMYSAGETTGIQLAAPESKEKVVFADGLRVVTDGPLSYILTKDRLYALDRAHWAELSRLQAKSKRTPAEEARIAELGGDRRTYVKWDVPCPGAYELILAGKTLLVGELDRVTAFDCQNGKMVWRGEVRGKALGLAVDRGHLYASTDLGMIHCFASGTPPKAGPHRFDFVEALDRSSPYPDDKHSALYAAAAEAAIRRAGTAKGYCLVLGAREGRLAYEIARRSQFQVVGLEPDAARVAEARRRLREAGLYGTRISIHQGDPAKPPYQGLWANLVVSDQTLLAGTLPSSAAEVQRVLRPCGGCAVLMTPKASQAQAIADWGRPAGMELAGEKTAPGLVASFTRGPLPGAGEWSHFYGDPGNSACSGDAIPPGPVDVQWFGLPGPRNMPDRHDKNVGPLYKNGRLFVSGDNCLTGVDAYNGTILWQREVPQSVRLGAFKNCGNMAAADDALLVAAGAECLELDAQTGTTRRTFSLPPPADGSANEWAYVALAGKWLVGSAARAGAAFREQTIDTEVLIWRDLMPVVCSDELFAVDRDSGRRAWTYAPARGVIINPTLALGSGRAYFVQSTNPATRRVADGRIKLPVLLGQGADLVAVDLDTGKEAWRTPAGLEAVEHMLFLSCAGDKLLVTGTRNVEVDKTRRVRYDLAAFSAADGRPLWRNTQVPVPDHILEGPHGEQVQHPAIVGDVIYGTGFACRLSTGQPWEGWKWKKSGNCGTLSASARCGFSRYGTASMFDFQSGEATVLSSAIRPGCWINILPAGGLILMPEASAGCTCGYALQTSVALIPRQP